MVPAARCSVVPEGLRTGFVAVVRMAAVVAEELHIAAAWVRSQRTGSAGRHTVRWVAGMTRD